MKLSKFLTVIVLVIFGILLMCTDNFPLQHEIDYLHWVEGARNIMIITLYLLVIEDIMSEEQVEQILPSRYLLGAAFFILSGYIILTTDYVYSTIAIALGFIAINAVIVKKY